MKLPLQLVCIFVVCLTLTNGYNILISVAGLAHSQTVFLYRLGELLSEHGHDVTMLRSVFLPEIGAPKIKKIKEELVYTVVEDEEAQDTFRQMMGKVDWNHTAVSIKDIKKLGFFKKAFGMFTSSCDMLLDNEKIMNKLKATKYDVHAIHFQDVCSIGLAHVLGIKSTIQISTAFNLDFLTWFSGAPFPLAYLPSAAAPFSDRMTLPERLKNVIIYSMVNAGYKAIVLPMVSKSFWKRYGSDFPHLRSLVAETQLFLVNADHLIDFPRPDAPNTVYIGGFMMENMKGKQLDEEWEAVASSPAAKKHGFVIFSLGSVVNTKLMPFELKMEFFNALRRIPQQVIWRCEGELPKWKGTNIHITSWMPQADLLSHQNVVAFITHGGYNGVIESAYAGVPLIMLPLFGDQFANYQRVNRLGFGVRLDKSNLTEAHIYDTAQKLLLDERYYKNAKRLSKMFAMKPTSNREQAVKWIEFLAEFKTLDNLQPYAREMPLFRYLLLDIFAIIFVVLAVSLYCCCWCCKGCCRTLCGGKAGKTKHD